MQDPELVSIIDQFARFQNDCADVFIDTATFLKPKEGKLVAICADQFNFMADRSNTLFELIKLNAVWDAQILIRPLIESCIKTSFICFAPKSTPQELCIEYEETLGILNALKLHDKARKTLQASALEWHPTLSGLILPTERLAELREKVPKEKRREVESRWGFTQMVVDLDQQFRAVFEIAPFASLLHSYGFSSHLVHADEMGLGTIRARNRLEEPKRSFIVRSHHLSILDAVAGSAMIAALSLAWAAKYNLDKAVTLCETYNLLHGEDY